MKTKILWIFLLALPLVACGSNDEGAILPPETETPETPGEGNDDETQETPDGYNKLISKTYAVPAGYENEAEHRGDVVRINYNTRDYAEGQV